MARHCSMCSCCMEAAWAHARPLPTTGAGLVGHARPPHGAFTPLTQPLTRSPCHMQVIRCCLENACSVAKTFLLADVVVTEIPSKQPAAAQGGVDDYGY